MLHLEGLHDLVSDGGPSEVEVTITDADGADKGSFTAKHTLSDRQRQYLMSGGTTNWMRDRLE